MGGGARGYKLQSSISIEMIRHVKFPWREADGNGRIARLPAGTRSVTPERMGGQPVRYPNCTSFSSTSYLCSTV